MLRLEHDLLLWDVQERGRSKGCAYAEERQGRVVSLLVLAVQNFNPAADVQPLECRNKQEAYILAFGGKRSQFWMNGLTRNPEVLSRRHLNLTVKDRSSS